MWFTLTVPQVSISLPDDLLALVDDHTTDEISRSQVIRQIVRQWGGGAIGKTDTTATPRPKQQKTEDKEKPVDCQHPKASRVNLGYATKCGLCGDVVKR